MNSVMVPAQYTHQATNDHIEELRVQREQAVHVHWTPGMEEWTGRRDEECPHCEWQKKRVVVTQIVTTLERWTLEPYDYTI